MEPARRIDASTIAGYAVGVGFVAIATIGVYWRYWQPATSPWVWAGGSFLLGAVVGGAVAAWRRGRSS